MPKRRVSETSKIAGTGNGKPRNPTNAGQPFGATARAIDVKNQQTPWSDSVRLNNRTFDELPNPNGIQPPGPAFNNPAGKPA